MEIDVSLQRKYLAAVRTLERYGFTYHGGVEWALSPKLSALLRFSNSLESLCEELKKERSSEQ